MSFTAKVARNLVVAVAMTTISVGLVSAATERIIEYEYDGAGNVVRIVTQEQFDPPVIPSLSPGFINQGQSRTFTATGSNLLAVDVITDSPGLSISEVESSESEVSFQLTATRTAPVGEAVIRFNTALGEAQEVVFVAEALPDLVSNPNPVTVDLSGNPKTIQLTFSDPRAEDETYTLTTGDSSIAVFNSGSFTIPAGETQAVVFVTGISEGATDIQIVQPAKFYAYSFPVYASKSYLDLLAEFGDMQTRNLFANPIGVTVGSQAGLFASPVGVQFGGDLEGQVISKPVGVVFGDNLASPVFAPPVGVLISDTTGYAYTAPVGAVYGPIIDSSEPASVTVDSVDTVVDFTVKGFNLNEVQAVIVNPAENIVVGAFSANTDATELTISITIEPAAITGPRLLILESVSGSIPIRTGPTIAFEIQ